MKSLQQIRENFSEPLMLDMMRKAFNAKPDSPEQKKLIAQLNAYREKYGMDPVPIGELYKYDYGSPESMRLMKKITPGQSEDTQKEKMTFAKFRSGLYKTAKAMGDVQAVRK